VQDADFPRQPGHSHANAGRVHHHRPAALMREMKCLTAADLAAGSGGFPQVGEIRMAFTVRAAMRSLAAIPERRKIARIAGRPATQAWCQIDNDEAAMIALGLR